MERSKKSAFSLAELMITLLILSIVLSAVMPAVTKRNAGQESVWRWLYDGSHAYFGTGPQQEALIGMAVKPELKTGTATDGAAANIDDYGVYGKLGDYTYGLLPSGDAADFKMTSTGDRLLIMKYTYKDPSNKIYHPMSNSHITFFSTTFDDSGAEVPHYAGRLSFDETNIAIGKYTFANMPYSHDGDPTEVAESRRNNLALGQYSQFSLDTGFENVGIGNETLYANKTGYRNVALGFQSLTHNTTGYENNALGYQALFKNEVGKGNNAVGHQAGFGIVNGDYNTAIGSFSLKENPETTSNEGGAQQNTAVGYGALYKSAASNNNTAIGALSGNNNIGDNNVFAGAWSAFNNAGSDNVMMGFYSGFYNTVGYNNVFIGSNSGLSNTEGYGNVYIGKHSGGAATAGYSNVLIGEQAGYSNSNSLSSNVMIGYQSGMVSYSNNNTFVGYRAGFTNTTGFGNVFLGYNAGSGNTVESNRFAISNGQDIMIGQFPSGESDDTTSHLTTMTYNANLKSTITNIGPDTNTPILKIDGSAAGGSIIAFGAKIKPAGEGNPINVEGDVTVNGSMTVDSLTVTNNFTPPASWHPWAPSDKRLKNINGSADKGLSAVDEMNIVKYTYKSDETKKEHIGVIAQELKKILPNAVMTRTDGYLAIDVQDIMFTVAKAVQELHQAVIDLAKEVKDLVVKVTTNSQKIEALEKENASLKKQINDLDARLKKLEEAK